MTPATHLATNVLKFSTTQNAISAWVGHLILLGQKKKAMILLEHTTGLMDIPDNTQVHNDSDDENDEDDEHPTSCESENEDVDKDDDGED